MSLALVTRDADKVALLNPLTGALVPLDSSTEEIAEALDALADFAWQGREAIALGSDELLRRMDKRGKWTAEVGGYQLKAQSPTAGTTDYDETALRADLLKLVEDGAIDYEAVQDAVELVDPPKPAKYLRLKRAGVAALLKLSPEVVEVVQRHRVEKDPPARKVKVTRRTSE